MISFHHGKMCLPVGAHRRAPSPDTLQLNVVSSSNSYTAPTCALLQNLATIARFLIIRIKKEQKRDRIFLPISLSSLPTSIRMANYNHQSNHIGHSLDHLSNVWDWCKYSGECFLNAVYHGQRIRNNFVARRECLWFVDVD